MNIKEFKEEVYSHYFDEEQQVTVDRDPGFRSTNNGILHLGLFYVILGVNGAIDELDRKIFNESIDRCWVVSRGDGTLAPVKIYGLLNRHKDHEIKQGQDDYIGACGASWFFKDLVASQITDYGEANYFSYDNQNPWRFSFSTNHWRFFGLPGFYRLCAHRSPGWLQTLFISRDLRCGPGDRADTSFMEWIKVQVIKRESGRFGKEVEIWENKFKEKWGTLGRCLAEYFGETHPFSQIHNISGEIQKS